MLWRRHEGRRMKTAPQEHDVPLPSLSLRHRRLTGFTIVQVFTKRRLGHVLIKPDIYTGSGKVTQRGMGPGGMGVLTFCQFVLLNDSNSLPPIIHAKSCSAWPGLICGAGGVIVHLSEVKQCFHFNELVQSVRRLWQNQKIDIKS